MTANTTKRCTQDSNKQRHERMRLQRERSKAALELNVARIQPQDRLRQQTSRTLTGA